MNYKSYNTQDLDLRHKHGYILTGVAPRPIALVSSIDAAGNVNLSPFSNYNAFGSNPPILVFSPSRSGRTNETKDTYKNVLEVPEVVINVVQYDIAQQISLASAEYPRGTNEFIKSGLTPIPSDLVKPPRVAESPIQYECKVLETKELGDQGGAGILVICEVIRIHIKEQVMGEGEMIDPLKLDLIGRCGGPYYNHVEINKLFSIPQPQAHLGIGVDHLDSSIRSSKVLTGNNLGQLGTLASLPDAKDIEDFKTTETYKYLNNFTGEEKTLQVHRAAQEMLHNDNSKLAMITLYSFI